MKTRTVNEFNYFLSRSLRRGYGEWLVQKARIRGQRFYCKALAGQSDYNVSINCDLTVSCNCRDYDGEGQLGNLREADFEELFAGAPAVRLRSELAAGRLPLANCSRCPELVAVPAARASSFVANYSLPAPGVMLENGIQCNLACLSCARLSVARVRTQKRMSLEDVRRVAEVLGRIPVRKISFFNLGEPFLAPDVLEQLKIIREYNPSAYISSSTNGLPLDSEDKWRACLLLDEVHFSIDGITTEMAGRYQKGTNFQRAYDNLAALVRYRNGQGLTRPAINWKYVVFRWNDQKAVIERAIALARAAGVNSIYFAPTFSPLYGISFRYFLGSYFRGLGRGGPLGWRWIDFNQPP